MAVERLKKRDEIEKKYKWVLEDIYPSTGKWEEDFKIVKDRLPAFLKFSGKLPQDPSKLSIILDEHSLLTKKVEKLFVYAHLKKDEDNADQKAQALMDRARALLVETEGTCSFLVPDILKIDTSVLKKIMEGYMW